MTTGEGAALTSELDSETIETLEDLTRGYWIRLKRKGPRSWL